MRLPTPAELAALSPHDHISIDYRREVARMGRASLFFFSKYLFGRTGLNNRAHRSFCDFAQQVILTPNALGVAEDPRGSGKSNGSTIPIPAWCFIQDPEECRRNGWVRLGPECNIAVASYKVPFATIFISDTQKTIENNDLFRWAYPEIRPGTPWRTEFWSIERQRTTGYSCMALGTESGSTSLHPDVLIIDDMLNEENYMSPAEVDNAVRWVDHSVDLTATQGGARLIVQNEWSERGVNADRREKNKKNPFSTFFFSRSRVICDACCDGMPLDQYGNPIYCEHLTHEARPILDTFLSDPEKPYTMADVEALKASMPRVQWFCQHMNNPLALEEREWRENWLRRFVWDPVALEAGGYVARMLLGSGGLSGNLRVPAPERVVLIPVEQMEVIAALDPGLVAPGLMCSGRAHVPGVGEVVFVLDEGNDSVRTPRDQMYWLFDCVHKYKASRLVFESVAVQDYLYQTIGASAEQYERERGVKLPWWLTNPNKDAARLMGVRVDKVEGNKQTRVRNTLSPLFEQRLVAVHPKISVWLDEYAIFPKGRRIDHLDAFAMTIKAWKILRPLSEAAAKAVEELAVADLMAFEHAMQEGSGYNADRM